MEDVENDLDSSCYFGEISQSPSSSHHAFYQGTTYQCGVPLPRAEEPWVRCTRTQLDKDQFSPIGHTSSIRQTVEVLK